MPLLRRTRAILRKAEFGFFGVVVLTFTHTPRLNGEEYATGRFFFELNPNANAGDFVFALVRDRPERMIWLNVGIGDSKIRLSSVADTATLVNSYCPTSTSTTRASSGETAGNTTKITTTNKIH